MLTLVPLNIARNMNTYKVQMKYLEYSERLGNDLGIQNLEQQLFCCIHLRSQRN